jgi:ABC-2 type transport system permease protein
MASKTILVAQREFLENVRTKTFWVGILMFPIIMAIAFGVAWLMEKTKGTRRYAVLDYTAAQLSDVVEKAARAGDFAWSIRKLLRSSGMDRDKQPDLQVLDDLELTPAQEAAARDRIPPDKRDDLEKLLASTAKKYQRVPLAELGLQQAPREEQVRRLDAMLHDGRLFAYFLFDGDPVQKFEGSLLYVSDNQTDNDLPDWYGNATTRVVRKLRISEAHVDPATAKHIQESAHFEAKKLNASTGAFDDVPGEVVANKWAPVAFVYLLWIAVFTAAQMLLTNTVEEKSSRIIEVLLSSASPSELMHGKIWGIGATGLTIIGSWVAFALFGVWLTPRLVPSLANFKLLDIVGDPLYLASFVGYFLGGYLLFAAVLVAIGSVCNSLKEAQNLQQPVMVLLMIPIFAMVPIVQEPNGMMARVFTYIPLYTPFAMMNRASGPPAPWEYAVTSVLIVVSVMFAFRAAGKIFRIGVLMTGNPPRLKEILGWLRER